MDVKADRLKSRKATLEQVEKCISESEQRIRRSDQLASRATMLLSNVREYLRTRRHQTIEAKRMSGANDE